jgi:hypothetical protein
LATLL